MIFKLSKHNWVLGEVSPNFVTNPAFRIVSLCHLIEHCLTANLLFTGTEALMLS